jgi:hypothetical protein
MMHRLPSSQTRSAIAACLFIALGLCSPAVARKADINFTAATELSSLGLRIRLMPNAVETPAATPIATTYRVTDNKGTRTLDAYPPSDLWRQRQFAGAWVDADGNRLTVAEIRTAPLGGLPHPLITRDEFEEAMKRAEPIAAKDTPEALTAWAAAFTGLSGITPTVVTKPPSRLRKLVTFTFAGKPTEWACAFRPPPSAYTTSGTAPDWIFVQVTCNTETPAAKLQEAVNSQFLPNILRTNRAPKENDNPSAVFQNRRTAVGEESDAHANSRQQVIDSIRNMNDWWYAETPNFILLSNLDRKHRDVIKELQLDLEKWRVGFTTVIPPAQPIHDISVVRMFATDTEYESYVDREQAWSSGLWIPVRKELVIRPMAGSTAAQKDRYRGIVAHEAFHQYITYALNYVHTSPWFNEGHAALFETAEIAQGKIRLEESPSYTPTVETLVKAKGFSIQPILRMDYPAFYASDKNALRNNYALAYALIYYLHKSAARNPKSPFHDALAAYIREIEAGKDPSLATTEVFGKAAGPALDSDMADFWTSPTRRRTARQQPLLPVR